MMKVNGLEELTERKLEQYYNLYKKQFKKKRFEKANMRPHVQRMADDAVQIWYLIHANDTNGHTEMMAYIERCIEIHIERFIGTKLLA
jgi:hypothetical protein